MNADTTERFIEQWISTHTSGIEVIRGASNESRTYPSVRIVCQSCNLPEGMTQAVKERTANVIIAVIYDAHATTSPALAQTFVDSIQERMDLLNSQLLLATPTPPDIGSGSDFDIICHASFLEDQATENDETNLLYGATYSIFYAYNNPA